MGRMDVSILSMLCPLFCKNQTVFFVVERGQFGNIHIDS